ncbi:MAG: hypothetical protein IT529_06475 [Burkholderiales bacterium]|nr:hypothetical protein [Burkholderiales bacterium]
MCSVHDTVEFEKRGIPATVIVTQVFSNAARHSFRSKGMEGHELIELPHPVSNLSAPEMRALALRRIGELVRQLTA